MTKTNQIFRPVLRWPMTLAKSIFVLLIIAAFLHEQIVEARKHHLEVRVSFFSLTKCLMFVNVKIKSLLQTDDRPYIALSTFGFYTLGHLNVNLSKLVLSSETGNEKVKYFFFFFAIKIYSNFKTQWFIFLIP